MAVPDDEDNFDPHRGNIEPHGFEPSYARWPSVTHYYGDVVRELFLGAAALMLITSPLYADSLSVQFPFIVVGALAVVALAAFTNPHKRWSLMGDCVVAGVGVVVYAVWGLAGYGKIASPIAFVLQIAIALIFLFAFYYALKTVRAFSLHQIGKRDRFDEFQEPLSENEEETVQETEKRWKRSLDR